MQTNGLSNFITNEMWVADSSQQDWTEAGIYRGYGAGLYGLFALDRGGVLI